MPVAVTQIDANDGGTRDKGGKSICTVASLSLPRKVSLCRCPSTSLKKDPSK
ncbi:hypothetical protein K443DRAFT_674446 [Laccaria amethystina LaAM-08-1]|uniref:Uncharacterized protein n=1 Tax=Laccaria amethystina LaAM-08-1 TaxID=1095629 RepID=A0A0C9XM55_9AGAR|nr:hypothetical protein K443DRAFT_674446 [Laccaria amethystina LaAM-08-1]